jgi:isopentenyl-diphosphate delta-isomerase
LIENRKADHIRICLTKDVQARRITTGLEDVYLIHRALPEMSFEDVDTSASLFGHRLSAPVVIEAMTGGTLEAERINRVLAQAAEHFRIAMGVGSQRAALERRELEHTFRVARDAAPNAFLIGNIGLSQLLKKGWEDKVKRAVEMIEADALAIHLNALQEAIQPEGDTNFKEGLERIKEVASNLQIPIIVKETGAGIAYEEAKLLETAKVNGIDVGGAGGTSWAAVESYRERRESAKVRELGETFWDWGIPTAVTTIEVLKSTNLTVIASGGIRTGIDVAKVIALGAEAAGLAWPLLKPAVEGYLKDAIRGLIEELRVSMFLTGSKTVKELEHKPIVITGKTAQWLRARGFNPEEYAIR